MFGKIKSFATRKLLEKQMKDAPKEQQEMVMKMFEQDPELLETISKEIEAETKKGLSQMQASMKVMPKYQARLQKLMGGQMGRTPQGFNPNGTIRK
ncbi:hypothetical protein KTR10_02635 [Candidatus Kaiserbacteria bacterium]|nr:hypothetical protein [Candidatus Kaiserbacteria bacterium]